MSVDSCGDPYMYAFGASGGLFNADSDDDSVTMLLKPQQESAIEAAQVGDVLAVLPCGFGKTKIAEEAPPAGKIAIIASPLNSIITEQKIRYEYLSPLICSFA